MPATQNSSDNQYFYVPQSDKNRLVGYTKYENIFIGNHEKAFNPKINFSPEDDNLYIKELVGQLISYTSADYLFGEPLKISAESDEGATFLDETFYPANPELETKLYEASLSNSYFGDIVIELKIVEDKPMLMFQDPRAYTIKKNKQGEIEQHILSFVLTIGDTFYIRQRIHEKGKIKNKVYRVENSRSLSEILIKYPEQELQEVTFESIGMPEVEDEVATGIAGFMVYNVPNMRLLNAHFGISDYLGKESLMNSYNVLTSFAHLVLEKTADPAMEVPDGTFDPTKNVYLEDLKVFQVDAETKGTTAYITPDTQSLERLFEQREHVMSMIALYSEISLSLMGKDSNGAVPDNFRAMKLRFHRTIQKMNRKKRYWEPAIKWAIQTSQELLGQTPDEYTFEWEDGLPDDMQTYLEERMAERNLGVTSNETLIEEFGRKKGWTEKRIQEEKDRLLNQDKQGIPSDGPSGLFKRETELTDGQE